MWQWVKKMVREGKVWRISIGSIIKDIINMNIKTFILWFLRAGSRPLKGGLRQRHSGKDLKTQEASVSHSVLSKRGWREGMSLGDVQPSALYLSEAECESNLPQKTFVKHLLKHSVTAVWGARQFLSSCGSLKSEFLNPKMKRTADSQESTGYHQTC